MLNRDGFYQHVPLLVSLTGFLLLVWSFVDPVYLLAISSPDVYRLQYLIGYVTIVPSCLFMIGYGRWLPETEISEEYNATIGLFGIAGGAGFLVFNGFLMLFFPTDSIWIITNWARWALSLGLAVGLVIGVLYVRGLSESLSAERHSLRAEHIEKQRELVDHMNGILRHEVLNSAQIIRGNAQLLMESEANVDPADERLNRIYREGEELADVIGEVRGLLNTVEGGQALQPIRLTDVINHEVEKLKSTYPEVTVKTTIPDEMFIEGDDLVGRVVGNLLRNAVMHNSADRPQVRIDGEITDEETVVSISDNGDGIPEHQFDTLFERPQVGTHGLGMYLVKALMDSYGGTVELVTTGRDGTTIEVAFPPVESPGSP
ncbi:HAMP domain-containing histidine kinase [Natronomonas salina]|uniref:sensor histidine kinase n=1 Tax=Natronomonas salina TaxID=1710540 RepID=UPI0015B40BA4|nr:HAMP domain-containing sensor histidine kinase [Natronomonas salina]QLD90353.1 HAMP domain-containing histidine kinase [Natronomonas salina]